MSLSRETKSQMLLNIKELKRLVQTKIRFRILLLDDDQLDIKFITARIQRACDNIKLNAEIVGSTCPMEFMDRVKDNCLLGVCVDINLGIENGIDVVEDLKHEGFLNCPVFFISESQPAEKYRQRIEDLNSKCYEKPIQVKDWENILCRIGFS